MSIYDTYLEHDGILHAIIDNVARDPRVKQVCRQQKKEKTNSAKVVANVIILMPL
jgi:hypothetical protein